MPSAEEGNLRLLKRVLKAGAVIPVTPDMEGIDGGKVISNNLESLHGRICETLKHHLKTLED